MLKKNQSRDISNPIRIQGTNDNSILSKCSMINYGYFDDKFLPFMISKFSRRAPLINRGYYIRAKAIDHILRRFIDAHKDASFQIVSLGAGFDTAFFRLTDQQMLQQCVFVELDYPSVASKKMQLIRQEPQLWSCLRGVVPVPDSAGQFVELNADNYKLIGADMTRLDVLDACLNHCGVSYDKPTLLLSECVITYIGVKKTRALLHFFSKYFSRNSFVVYEQIHPDDTFGRFMCQHFKNLGSSLRGIGTYKTKECHIRRFTEAGWDRAVAVNMADFFYEVVSPEERRRIESLEVFDEYEEWLLKCYHYFVLVASKGLSWDPGLYQKVSPESISSHPLQLSTHKCADKSPHPGGGTKCHYCHLGLLPHPLSPDDVLLVRISGYGQNPFSAGHSRLASLTIVDPNNNFTVLHIEPSNADLLVGSLCGSVCQLDNALVTSNKEQSATRFILFGGRSSPLRPSDLVLHLTVWPIIEQHTEGHQEQLTSWQAQCDMLLSQPDNQQTATPSPRWRHVAALFQPADDNRSSMMLVHGGRGTDPNPLADTFVLDIERAVWHQVHEDGGGPGPLMGAAAVSVGHSVVMVGGLSGRDLQVCGAVWIFCGSELRWYRVGEVAGRFSHSLVRLPDSHDSIVFDLPCVANCGPAKSLLKSDTDEATHNSDRDVHDSLGNHDLVWLACVGGVGISDCGSMGLTQLTVCIRCKRLLAVSDRVIATDAMLHNHAARMAGDTLWLMGGGGNCFSFGTSLNEHVYSARLRD